MSRKLAALLLLLLAAPSSSRSAVSPGNQFVSGNQQYSVELSKTPEDKIEVTVFDLSKEPKTLQWSRTIGWQPPHPFWNSPGSGVSEVKAFVTSDGATVVLRNYFNTLEDNNGIRFLGRGEENNHVIRPLERRELTGARPPESFQPEHRYTRGMRQGTSYMVLTALFDLIVDDQDSYAMWFGQTDQWLLISLKDRKQTVVNDAATLDRLNDLARRKALELVLEHQPPPLRKMLATLKEQVAKIIPSARPLTYQRHMGADTAAAYLFLTTRRNSSDKSLIEGLLDYPAQGTQNGHPILHGTDRPLRIDCIVTHGERLIGDFLLSQWNGETNREALPRETSILLPQDSFRHLGSIKINFQLPMPLPSTNAGILWAYAIPAALPSGKWQKSDEVLAFDTHLSQLNHLRPNSAPLGPEAPYVFRGLTPGDYRFKLIWERHPARTWRTNFYAAIPGDYESLETKPITVKAGETMESIPLACTNRLGGPEVYEADDRLMKNRVSIPRPASH